MKKSQRKDNFLYFRGIEGVSIADRLLGRLNKKDPVTKNERNQAHRGKRRKSCRSSTVFGVGKRRLERGGHRKPSKDRGGGDLM